MDDDDRSAADADVSEQQLGADGTAEGPFDELAGGIGDRPEADVLEQAEVVDEQQTRDAGRRPEDAAEADWLEQSIAEQPADERR